jgi:hypothetical protein
MRMQMRRFTRLTNAFSKKVEYHLYAVALHTMFYNYCRPHMTLEQAAGWASDYASDGGWAGESGLDGRGPDRPDVTSEVTHYQAAGLP